MADEDAMDFDAISMQIEVHWDGEPLRLQEAINAAVEKCAQGALDSGKLALMDLQLSFKPDKRDTLLIAAKIKTKVAEPGTFPIRVFADKKGQLTMTDPGQGKLRELRPDDHERMGSA